MSVRTEPLSRERIVEAAVRVADRSGLTGVSMRTVGKEVGAEAMSLYHHVHNKDALLDALGDWIFTRIRNPAPDAPWRAAMTDRAASARAVFSAHPWALTLVESRRVAGPALLAHHNAVLGCLRTSGFPVPLAAHAFSALDAYVYGFALTEQNIPLDEGESIEDFIDDIALPMAGYPFLAEYMAELVTGKNFTYADEFSYGLDLILDQLTLHLPETSADRSSLRTPE